MHSPPIDAIRLIFAEEVERAGGAISTVYDVGGVLYARAELPGRAGDLVAGVALRVSDDQIEVRPAATWGDAACALIETQLSAGRLIALPESEGLGPVRQAVHACVDPAVFDSLSGEQRSAAARVIEHPGNVVLSLITALAGAGDVSERLLSLVPAIMNRLQGIDRPTDWAAVDAVASMGGSVKGETTRWHLDVLAGRLLLIRPSTGRQAWAG